jgi:hypothetical protein
MRDIIPDQFGVGDLKRDEISHKISGPANLEVS